MAVRESLRVSEPARCESSDEVARSRLNFGVVPYRKASMSDAAPRMGCASIAGSFAVLRGVTSTARPTTTSSSW